MQVTTYVYVYLYSILDTSHYYVVYYLLCYPIDVCNYTSMLYTTSIYTTTMNYTSYYVTSEQSIEYYVALYHVCNYLGVAKYYYTDVSSEQIGGMLVDST